MLVWFNTWDVSRSKSKKQLFTLPYTCLTLVWVLHFQPIRKPKRRSLSNKFMLCISHLWSVSIKNGSGSSQGHHHVINSQPICHWPQMYVYTNSTPQLCVCIVQVLVLVVCTHKPSSNPYGLAEYGYMHAFVTEAQSIYLCTSARSPHTVSHGPPK